MLYARLSVTKEESVSIERQLESTRKYAEGRGWEVVGEFVDDGVSATANRPEDRRGWNALLEEADFDEDGRHDGIAQDEESRPFLESPVGQIQDGFQVGLDAVPQHEAAGGPGNKRFRAAGPAVIGVEMNGYEEITFGLIGLVADTIEVIVLPKDNGYSISF